MAALAFKAIGYGADKIPDKFFEKIPLAGGFFTPDEKKRAKDARDTHRRKSEERHRRKSRRDRTPPTDYSDYSGYDDTDYEREYRDKQRRRRAKSLGGQDYSRNRSASRGRYRERSRDLDGEYEMDRTERGADFPPPPTAEYRPYNPADYAPAAAATATSVPIMNDFYDRRTSSARPEYGYPAQPQPSIPRASTAQSRYTPAGAYAPSPVNTAFPPPAQGYAPYNPTDYASPHPATYSPSPAAYKAPGNAYASPPPFYRQESRSQPSIPQYPPPETQLAYPAPPIDPESTSSSRRHRKDGEKRHRARSAGHHKRSRSRVTDQLRDRFDSLDVRDKGLAASVGGALAGGLAGNAVGHGTLSTLVGAAIGGLGGRELEKRHEKKKSAREGSRTSKPRDDSRSRRSSSRRDDYSRSPSRDRKRDDRYDSYSDSDSDSRHRAARRRRNSRRPSRRDSEDRR